MHKDVDQNINISLKIPKYMRRDFLFSILKQNIVENVCFMFICFTTYLLLFYICIMFINIIRSFNENKIISQYNYINGVCGVCKA